MQLINQVKEYGAGLPVFGFNSNAYNQGVLYQDCGDSYGFRLVLSITHPDLTCPHSVTQPARHL